MQFQMQDWELTVIMAAISALSGGTIAVPVRFQGQTMGLNIVFQYNAKTGHVDVTPFTPAPTPVTVGGAPAPA